ncbi:MAG: hypothetical protein LBC72_03190 [Spirochaetaceae bacterium]|nr:hypothetical protein [Spirochaetaceae bacterium]
MLRVMLLNLGFLAIAALFLFAAYMLRGVPVFAVLALAAGLAVGSIYLVAAALSVKTLSDYGTFGPGDFLKNIKPALCPGLLAAALIAVVVLLAAVVIPFYVRLKTIPGLFIAILLFWALAGTLLALQFFPAVCGRLEPDIKKAIKKCYILFFDNTAFCVFSFLHNLVFLALSVFFVLLLVPGPCGMLLFLDEGLRLRLFKYDYLEQHPGTNRRAIPWNELLQEERETAGSRTLKSFIFPWKS